MCTVFVFENVKGQKFLASSVVLLYFKQILTSGTYSQFHCPTDSGQSLSVEALGMGEHRQRWGRLRDSCEEQGEREYQPN